MVFAFSFKIDHYIFENAYTTGIYKNKESFSFLLDRSIILCWIGSYRRKKYTVPYLWWCSLVECISLHHEVKKRWKAGYEASGVLCGDLNRLNLKAKLIKRRKTTTELLIWNLFSRIEQPTAWLYPNRQPAVSFGVRLVFGNVSAIVFFCTPF